MNRKMMVVSIVLLIVGCATTVKVDLSAVYVPQESGLKFFQITTMQDKLATPLAYTTGNSTYSRLDPVFDVSLTLDKVAFLSGTINQDRIIFVKNLSNLQMKQQRTFNGLASNIAFSPDGKRMAFCGFKDSTWNLYMVDTDSGVTTQQLTQMGSVSSPAFFPSGDKVLFVRSESSYTNRGLVVDKSLWSCDVTSANLVQYGNGDSPSFFPNLQKVAIIRSGEIWTYDLNTGSAICILSSDKYDYAQPAVSPDGSQIAFQAVEKERTTERNRDIYLVNSDGTNLRQITFHPGNDYQPRWGKSGKTLYFVSQRGSVQGTYNIWSIAIE